MKSYEIVIACVFFPALSETFIYDYVKILKQKSFVFKIYSLRGSMEPDKCLDYFSSGLYEHTIALRTEIPHCTMCLPPWAKKAISACPGADVHVAHILMHDLEEIIRKNNVILHAHYLSPIGVIISILKERIHFPAILELHGLDIFRVGRAIPDEAKKILASFDVVIANCGQMELTIREILGNSINKTPIVRINHGIDLRKISQNSKLKTKDYLSVVSAARLVEKKGLDYFIRSIPHILSKHPNTQFQIVGDGICKENLIGMAKDLGVEKSVKFLGSKPNKEVLEIIEQADVFVLPCVEASDGDMDGIPNVIQEAGALGVPVCSTWISGISEIVEHGRTGILVQPRDPLALSQAVNTLLANPSLRNIMSLNAKRKAKKEFDMNKQFNKFLNIYEHLSKKYWKTS